jgi:3-oxoacyl-(acyl-carrier-protein) synthase
LFRGSKLKKRVVITGLGAIAPIGLNADEFRQGLSQAKKGMALITLFDTSPNPIKLTRLIQKRGVNPPAIPLETPEKSGAPEVDRCLTNSFGMGGQNCYIVINRFN